MLKPLGEEAELEEIPSVEPRGFQGGGDLGPPSPPTFLASLFAPQYINYFKCVPRPAPPSLPTFCLYPNPFRPLTPTTFTLRTAIFSLALHLVLGGSERVFHQPSAHHHLCMRSSNFGNFGKLEPAYAYSPFPFVRARPSLARCVMQQ